MDRVHLKLLAPPEGPKPATGPAEPPIDPPSYAFITSLKKRDPAALTELYRAHRPALLILARRLLGDDGEAEDLVHDVFVTAPKALRRYSGETGLGSFLCGILMNLSRRRLRSLRRRRRAMTHLLERGAQVSLLNPSADRTLERRQLALRLTVALDQLPFAQRAAVVLCLIEERPASEASGILGVPEATVRTRLFYGRKTLQDLLGDGE